MEQLQKERLEKIESKMRETFKAANQNYLYGNSSATWGTLEDSSTSTGCYKIRMWPGNPSIDLTYVCNDLRWQDTGDAVVCFSTEYFSFQTIAKMVMNTIDILENGE